MLNNVNYKSAKLSSSSMLYYQLMSPGFDPCNNTLGFCWTAISSCAVSAHCILCCFDSQVCCSLYAHMSSIWYISGAYCKKFSFCAYGEQIDGKC